MHLLTVSMQIATKFSTALEREIVHVKLSEEDRKQNLLSEGQPEDIAFLLAWVETQMAAGLDERLDDSVEKVTGRPPKSFDTFVKQNRATWQ